MWVIQHEFNETISFPVFFVIGPSISGCYQANNWQVTEYKTFWILLKLGNKDYLKHQLRIKTFGFDSPELLLVVEKK